jgi:F-type H+-transporting ATPase subunit b
MEILKALGVDWTLFVHIILFGISYLFFSNLILKPYMHAMHEREKRTVGNEENAVRLIEEANKLHEQYEMKARAINSEIKGLYDVSRTEAMEAYDEMVAGARAEASLVTRGAQAEIESQIEAARKSLSSEIPTIGAAIASKLAGKEISL